MALEHTTTALEWPTDIFRCFLSVCSVFSYLSFLLSYEFRARSVSRLRSSAATSCASCLTGSHPADRPSCRRSWAETESWHCAKRQVKCIWGTNKRTFIQNITTFASFDIELVTQRHTHARKCLPLYWRMIGKRQSSCSSSKTRGFIYHTTRLVSEFRAYLGVVWSPFAGIVITTKRFLFDAPLVKRFQENPSYTFQHDTVDVLHVGIDPSGGGKGSDYTICTVACEAGKRIVS